jgi:putative aminopeptidase FrvX
MLKPQHLKILTDLCNTPTAPYAEQHVIAYVLRWAGKRQKHLHFTRDPAGNVHLHYKRGRAKGGPLVIEAHLDHPGFIATGTDKQGHLTAIFRGGVKPSHFKNARAKFWLPAQSRWAVAKIIEAKTGGPHNALLVTLAKPKDAIPSGTLGMWDLPDARIKGKLFSARVCDDLAGAAAALCLLDELIARRIPGHVRVLLTRAEEVGFAGVLAVVKNGWIPKNSRVIGLETSKGSALAPQGAGAVIRVGDRTGTFSASMTHFVSQAAGSVADKDSSFHYQRKLMDGGTCNSTAFCAFGYDATGMCVALGNYHNMTIKGDTGWGDGAKAGPSIASETIHLDDFAGMVRILVETARRMPLYKPNFTTVKDRLLKLHKTEQEQLLYSTRNEMTND